MTNYQFYVEFFKLYPELASNDFYYSGESYAGVLVPTVALQILNHTTPENKVQRPSALAPGSVFTFSLTHQPSPIDPHPSALTKVTLTRHTRESLCSILHPGA